MTRRLVPRMISYGSALAVALLTNGGNARDLYEELYREIFAELGGVDLPAPLAPPDPPVAADIAPYFGRYERASAQLDVLAGPDGPVLVPLESSNELCELSLADGRVVSTAAGVGRQPHDAVQTAGGTIVVTNELGGGVVFVRDAAVVGSLPAGPVQPGGVAALDGYAAVADVQGNGVWVYDGAARRLVAHGPVGAKLTHAVALSGDLAAFADTDGGAVFIERIDPQLAQVAKVDAPGKPYGLAYDAAHRRLYVTLTASNLMRLIDVSDATKPRILGDVPTVQQPNSVAVDPRSGTVLVTGSAPGDASSLQIVTPALLPGG